MEPDTSLDAQGWEQRGVIARDAGRSAEAEACFEKALLQGERPLAMLGLALSQLDQNRPDDAIVNLRKAQQLSPQSGVISHLLASLSGETTQQAPAAFVTWLFNSYANRFDNHLASLAYQGPYMLHQLAERAGWAADASRTIVDLGCGTGLSGQPFRPYAAALHGIDLAPRMLEQAQMRGIYDSLQQAEVHAALKAYADTSCDTVIAADTLIYIGDVAELFVQVARILRPGGSFLITVERGEADFVLTRTGRYSHGDAYLQRCAKDLLDHTDQMDGTLRVEAGKFTAGRAHRFDKPLH